MRGDVVQTAVKLGNGKFVTDDVLKWLAALVRELRNSETVPCGGCGFFSTTSEPMTTEINVSTLKPASNLSNRQLDFRPSEAFMSVIKSGLADESVLTQLDTDDLIASSFSRALAMELSMNKKATLGNFGTWSLGQKPSLEPFVRFRSHSAINRMV